MTSGLLAVVLDNTVLNVALKTISEPAVGLGAGIAVGPVVGGLLLDHFWWGSRTGYPALNVRLFRDPRLSSAATAISLNFFAMAGVYFFMSFYGLLLVTGALVGYHSLSHATEQTVATPALAEE